MFLYSTGRSRELYTYQVTTSLSTNPMVLVLVVGLLLSECSDTTQIVLGIVSFCFCFCFVLVNYIPTRWLQVCSRNRYSRTVLVVLVSECSDTTQTVLGIVLLLFFLRSRELCTYQMTTSVSTKPIVLVGECSDTVQAVLGNYTY